MQDKINHALNLIETKVSECVGGDVAVFASFGKDSVVLLELARQIYPSIKVISIMTPYKPIETIHYKEYLTDLWSLNVITYQAPLLSEDLYKTDIHACCDHYKVSQVKQAIKDFNIITWFSGLRNTEGGDMRKFTEEVELKEDGLTKVNPILTFTEKDIWQYHALRNIPIHPLYLKGYRSLGCLPCSGITRDDEPERAQRWGGKKLECGIHTQRLR